MSNIAKIELTWKLYQQNVQVEKIASSLKKHRSTIFRWIKGIKVYGIRKFIKRYTQAKKRKRIKRIDMRAESLIVQRRREKEGVCGQKIVWYLKKFYRIKISVAQTYRILAKHFTLRSKWKKWTRRPALPKATAPRQVIQADTVNLGELFAINFIDTFTREAISIIVADQTSQSAAYALEKAFSFFDGSLWLQTDNGSEFKGIFRKTAKRYVEKLRQITPYQKEENGFIESFNRTLRRECVGWRKYKAKDKDNLQKYINKWLDEYHTERPHLSLNLQTPQEFVRDLTTQTAGRSAQA